jgi:hypothetical protein
VQAFNNGPQNEPTLCRGTPFFKKFDNASPHTWKQATAFL